MATDIDTKGALEHLRSRRQPLKKLCAHLDDDSVSDTSSGTTSDDDDDDDHSGDNATQEATPPMPTTPSQFDLRKALSPLRVQLRAKRLSRLSANVGRRSLAQGDVPLFPLFRDAFQQMMTELDLSKARREEMESYPVAHKWDMYRDYVGADTANSTVAAAKAARDAQELADELAASPGRTDVCLFFVDFVVIYIYLLYLS